jgi:hypothetical protein
MPLRLTANFKTNAMKRIILTLASIAALSFSLKAQETKETNVTKDKTLLSETADTTSNRTKADTAIVRIGKKDVKVIDHEGGTEIIWGKGKNKNRKDKSDKFDGHWEGIEFGFNSFAKPDYSMYPPVTKDFMSLNQGKSLEFNFNFYELNIGLSKNNVGLVSGMGLSFNNYRFENDYTIEKGSSRTEPVALGPNNLAKTKLAVSYLNVPLLLEFQIPVNQHEGRLYINAGIVGGVKIGSHTKVKYGNDKEKDRSGFNINSFNYAATARIGYKGVSLYTKYSLTPFFEKGKGPDLTPFTVGISFTD